MTKPWTDTTDEYWLSVDGGEWQLRERVLTKRRDPKGKLEPEHPSIVAAYHARMDAALAAADRMTAAERDEWRREHLAPHVLASLEEPNEAKEAA